MLRFWVRTGRSCGARPRSRDRVRPTVEGLEARALLASVPGADYELSGTSWADPGHITYSIAADGVQWDHGINALNATFDARFGAGAWERELARALATWQSLANIDVARVADSPVELDAPGRAQGDPRFGDLRFGGYAFPDDATALALTYFPPPNGSTIAGDVAINTARDFALGDDFDLYSVMLHETGHALGLDHATDPSDVMFARYNGIHAEMTPGAVAGIRAIYGARTADVYQRQGHGLGLASAIDVTAGLDASYRVTLDDASLTTIGDTEYFSVVAPTFPGASLRVTAAASNVSLLSPRVSVLDADGQLLDVAGNPDAWGHDVEVQVGQLVPGRRYYIAVTGATRDVFAVGAYQLRVSFLNTPTSVTPTPIPAPPPPAAPIDPSSPPLPTQGVPVVMIAPDSSEPDDAPGLATALGTIATTAVGDRSLHTAGDVDGFSLRAARAGIYQITAVGTSIRVLNGSGRVIARGVGRVTFRSPRARLPFSVEISAPGSVPVATYSLAIAPQGNRRPGSPTGPRPGPRRDGPRSLR